MDSQIEIVNLSVGSSWEDTYNYYIVYSCPIYFIYVFLFYFIYEALNFVRGMLEI